MKYACRLGEPFPRRVAVVRALRGLGDLLCVVPALRALRSYLPAAHVTLVGLPGSEWFVQRFGRYVDALLEFPGFPGIPELPPAVRKFPAFLQDAHSRDFDLALQMHGSGAVSNQFALLLGARYAAGYYAAGGYCPDPERFLPYDEHEPEVRRHLRLIEYLGLPLEGEDLEFPVYASDREQLTAALDGNSLLPGSYVCVHPGAYDPGRRWSPSHFASVADGLAALGLRVVLTGSGAESQIVAEVARQMRAPALNLAGETNLGAMAALLQGARLLVSNDTGVSHLAAALRTPSVVVFLTSDLTRWAPLDRRRHRVVSALLEPRQVLASQGQVARRDWHEVGQVESSRLIATPTRVLAEAVGLLQLAPEGGHAT